MALSYFICFHILAHLGCFLSFTVLSNSLMNDFVYKAFPPYILDSSPRLNPRNGIIGMIVNIFIYITHIYLMYIICPRGVLSMYIPASIFLGF